MVNSALPIVIVETPNGDFPGVGGPHHPMAESSANSVSACAI
jgi:hypothetical protein